MDIVTIDFETYYDKDYSLSKITTEAYVRDPRFEVIGVGVKVNDHPVDWYSGNNVGKFLNSLDYSNKAILAHNTAFDGAILSWHYGIRPAFWFDTMSMARPLHSISVGGSLKNLAAHYKLGAKGDEVINALGLRRADFLPTALARYAEYCCNDVELTYKLFRKLAKGFPASELKLIDMTMRLYTEPQLELDTDLLSKHLEFIETRQSSLVDDLELGEEYTEEAARTMLSSNMKFAQYLEALGVEAPTKRSKTTGQVTHAFSKTDKGFTDLLSHENPRVAAAAAARLGVKSTIERTRTTSLLDVASRGTLPVMLNYYGAHTGRFSGGDKMNMQNLPRGGALRKSVRAPAGMKLIACDSSQIEARVLAYVAGQQDLVDAFAEGRDVYSEFASNIYGKKITKADKVERFVGKTCILGLGYGMGGAKFKDTLAIGQGGISVNIPADEATQIVHLYRNQNWAIQNFWNRCSTTIMQMFDGRQNFEVSSHVPVYTEKEKIILPNKLPIRYPLLSQHENEWVYCSDARVFREAVKSKVTGQPMPYDKFSRIYGGKIAENVVQALARIVVSNQMLMIGQRYKVVMQVHDEIVILVDENEVNEAMDYMMTVMSTPPDWAPQLPVACEASFGDSYGECK